MYKRSSGLLADLEDGLEEELIKLNAVDSAGFCDSSASVDSPLTGEFFFVISNRKQKTEKFSP